jgi:hypothetical protein
MSCVSSSHPKAMVSLLCVVYLSFQSPHQKIGQRPSTSSNPAAPLLSRYPHREYQLSVDCWVFPLDYVLEHTDARVENNVPGNVEVWLHHVWSRSPTVCPCQSKGFAIWGGASLPSTNSIENIMLHSATGSVAGAKRRRCLGLRHLGQRNLARQSSLSIRSCVGGEQYIWLSFPQIPMNAYTSSAALCMLNVLLSTVIEHTERGQKKKRQNTVRNDVTSKTWRGKQKKPAW